MRTRLLAAHKSRLSDELLEQIVAATGELRSGQTLNKYHFINATTVICLFAISQQINIVNGSDNLDWLILMLHIMLCNGN